SSWCASTLRGPSTPRRSRRCRTRSTGISATILGDDQVGLLTRDVVVNRDAPILVMTSRGSPELAGHGPPSDHGRQRAALGVSSRPQAAISSSPIWIRAAYRDNGCHRRACGIVSTD